MSAMILRKACCPGANVLSSFLPAEHKRLSCQWYRWMGERICYAAQRGRLIWPQEAQNQATRCTVGHKSGLSALVLTSPKYWQVFENSITALLTYLSEKINSVFMECFVVLYLISLSFCLSTLSVHLFCMSICLLLSAFFWRINVLIKSSLKISSRRERVANLSCETFGNCFQ